MTLDEYTESVHSQITDICVAAVKGIPGLSMKESMCTVNAELIAALSKMLVPFNHDTRIEIASRLVAQSDIHHDALSMNGGFDVPN